MNNLSRLKKIRPFTVPASIEYEKFDLPNGPLDLEIGCGVGLHPIQYQKENKGRTLIAIEHTKEKFDKFFRRFINHDSPENLLPIHANAISWVAYQLPKDSIDKIFLLYPNPNPKARDFGKRWHGMPFMNRLLETLKFDGELTLATNEKFYRDEALEYFVKVWGLKLKKENLLLRGDLYRTHFEKKYLERDEVCYNLVFKKKD